MGALHLGVHIFMLKKARKTTRKTLFLRNMFLYHHINVQKLIKTINNQKIESKV